MRRTIIHQMKSRRWFEGAWHRGGVFFLVLLVVCSVDVRSSIESSAGTVSSRIRAKLEARIAEEADQIRAQRDESPPLFASRAMEMPLEWQIYLDAQAVALDHLTEFVRQTPDEQLPNELVALFLEHPLKRRFPYPILNPYILDMGEEIVPFLMERYDGADNSEKARLVETLGWIGSQTALPVVKKALDEPDPAVSLLAQTALRLILKLKARPELERFLVETRPSWELTHTLSQLAIIGGDGWWRHFFRLASTGKLLLTDLSVIGVTAKDCPAEIIQDHRKFLLAEIVGGDDADSHEREIFARRRIAKQMVLTLEKKEHLLELAPLLPKLLAVRYGLGGVTQGFSRKINLPSESGALFEDYEAEGMLNKMFAVFELEDIDAWLRIEFSDFLTKLFLREWRSRVIGEPDSSIPVEGWMFRLEVKDSSGMVRSSVDIPITLGVERDVTLALDGTDGVIRRVRYMVQLDPDAWVFRIDPIQIDFKPSGAIFGVDVPFAGSNETSIHDTVKIKQERFYWKFTHAGFVGDAGR